jgi:hypothetical protein
MTSASIAPGQRLDDEYARVGAVERFVDGSSGRSIVEALRGQLNGYDVAVARRAEGFTGCWVLELGTNDAANVSAGSTVDLPSRIDRMMSVVGTDPVLWVDVTTRVEAGDYASSNMVLWDAALTDARARYPLLRVFAWSNVVRDEWFLSDGIHYKTEGSVVFARTLADALVAAFPG